jgi:transcription initiation factor IIF auxiliary subunit
MKIAQREEYQGDDWWEWAVWIEGKPEEIKSIRSVTYVLHPSFRDPIRKVTNRRTKFCLESEGWGGFVMAARVETESGKTRLLKHELELFYPPEPLPTKASRPQKLTK